VKQNVQLALHREASRFERRMIRAFVKASKQMRARVQVLKLADAILAKNIFDALKACRVDLIPKTYGPVSGISRDAMERGGKVGARIV